MPDLTKFNYNLENKNLLQNQKKAGRKKINDVDKKNNYIRISLNNEDFDKVQDYCLKKGIQPAVFCRGLIKDFFSSN